MYVTFIKDFTFKEMLEYKEGETIWISQEHYARYLIRKGVAVASIR